MGSRARHSESTAGDAKRDFEGYYRESYPTVYNYVRLRAGSGATEAIVAEAFLEAARSFDSYDPARAEFSDWVIEIAKNCLSDSRQKAVAAAAPIPEPSLGTPDALLGHLDECERNLVLMKYRDGLSSADIASSTGIDGPTVATRLSHALSKMQVKAEAIGA